MSKVISFSISDKYLEKLRSLYPSLTDNLAAKQFLTDGLDSNLGNSLDGSLDTGLDGRVKSLIESELDGLLEVRLDATVGKLLTSLSERLSRLEERLDTNLDGGLDEMELLLRMQREASITSLIPTGEPSLFPTIGENPDMEPVATVETADTVEAVTEKDESVYEDEPDNGAIGPVGMTAKDAAKYLKTKRVTVSYDSLNRWINNEKIPDTSPQGKNALKHLILRDKLYYPKPD